MHRQMIISNQRMKSKPMSNVFARAVPRSFTRRSVVCNPMVLILVSSILQLIYLYGFFISSLLLWALCVTEFRKNGHFVLSENLSTVLVVQFVNSGVIRVAARESVYVSASNYKLFVLHK